MVILYILSGVIFGSAAAAFTIWSGGSILLAVLAYTVGGTLAAMTSVIAIYMIQETAASARWPDGDKTKDTLAA